MEIKIVALYRETILMAEITTNDRKRNGRIRKNIRIDLTPMVDLGFLLITFFVFTTTMNERNVTDIVVPNDTAGPADPVCESCALTFLPGKNNQLFYYEGMSGNAVYKTTTYDAEGLRKIIIDKKNLIKRSMNKDRLIVIIKPSAKSSFRNLMDIVDETTICQVKKYYIDEPDAAEQLKIEWNILK